MKIDNELRYTREPSRLQHTCISTDELSSTAKGELSHSSGGCLEGHGSQEGHERHQRNRHREHRSSVRNARRAARARERGHVLGGGAQREGARRLGAGLARRAARVGLRHQVGVRLARKRRALADWADRAAASGRNRGRLAVGTDLLNRRARNALAVVWHTRRAAAAGLNNGGRASTACDCWARDVLARVVASRAAVTGRRGGRLAVRADLCKLRACDLLAVVGGDASRAAIAGQRHFGQADSAEDRWARDVLAVGVAAARAAGTRRRGGRLSIGANGSDRWACDALAVVGGDASRAAVTGQLDGGGTRAAANLHAKLRALLTHTLRERLIRGRERRERERETRTGVQVRCGHGVVTHAKVVERHCGVSVGHGYKSQSATGWATIHALGGISIAHSNADPRCRLANTRSESMNESCSTIDSAENRWIDDGRRMASLEIGGRCVDVLSVLPHVSCVGSPFASLMT